MFKENLILFAVFVMTLVSCKETEYRQKTNQKEPEKELSKKIPEKNILIVEAIKKFGPEISSTYEKAVCTELVIQIIEKFHHLEERDKFRIRIITDGNIQDLIKENSPIPKGVFYALTEKGIGIPIKKEDVLEGDFVQFWTPTWGHCGIVKSISLEKQEMELYSSFPSTKGYGIQKFKIPEYTFFVRVK
ncbi:hypothetical protein [Chryseobacterium sp. Leaf394]|uniref:hypothetical protein n=1 Tax=Chryseobacterium sp. Leaf394 TaxID=1736361 RepID=UPI0006F4ECCE|nr:hypothetical protein [Chryseobacterium sp. Leaf394]KQS93032.1 hypothetical protein ASG21_11555 [Chryseobacterium sp. Leaf394]